MKTITVYCEWCNEPFKIKPSRLKYGRGLCCSLDCSYKMRAKNARKRVTKTCERCGKAFEITPSMDAKGKGRFCSIECKYPPILVICANCGTEFRASPSANAQYCSQSCAYASEQRSETARENALQQWQDPVKRQRTIEGLKHRSDNPAWRKHFDAMRGPTNPRWKGGKRPPREKGKHTEAYRWRIAVFRRDDYTCQHCGKKGAKLNAHHTKSWIDFPKLRYDIDNGITLCYDCHLAIHGRKRSKYPHRCITCGKVKNSGKYLHCQSCGTKASYDRRGRKPPYLCADCGKQLSHRTSTRCSSCATRHRATTIGSV